jgi:hypothetical protein
MGDVECRDERRRDAVRAVPELNGLDYLEVEPIVHDDPAQGVALVLFFLAKAPRGLEAGNIRLEGGRRIPAADIAVTGVSVYAQDDPERDDSVRVYLDRWGDFSAYTLRLVEADAAGRPTDTPLRGFDRRYDRLEFNFQAACPSDLDCRDAPPCPPPEYPPVALSYLAKDYASFRPLILDRLALLMPGWSERHVPDIGIALAELLAYAGDQLSYYQDAVASEAYLETARQRISVRRHVRLVDYPMHDGCNARAWVAVHVTQDLPARPEDEPLDARDVFFITDAPGLPTAGRALNDDELRHIAAEAYEVFEPVVERDAETFRPIDLIEPEGLALVLKQADTPEARYLHSLLSNDTRHMLEAFDHARPAGHALQAALLADLNQLLAIRGLYDPRYFGALAIELLVLVRQPLRGAALCRANRRLIEQAFRGALRRAGKLYFYAAHSTIGLYTWGDAECCLPRGATSATLRDAWELQGGDPPRLVRSLRHLRPGDVLIFAEQIGPRTGNPADADPAHRHAVRLTAVHPGADELFRLPNPIEAAAEDLATPIVTIEWAPADALPFPLCLSAIGPAPECALLTDISVAHGNVVLADHGRTVAEDLGYVPIAELRPGCAGERRLAETTLVPGRFQPYLHKAPLTFSQPIAPDAPAADVLGQDPRLALPHLALRCPADAPGRGDWVIVQPDRAIQGGVTYVQEWSPRRDLLGSSATDPHFAVEVDDAGRAHVRFGDGELGMQPEAGAHFSASYRVGNGPAGNVGAGRIMRMVLRGRSIRGVGVFPHNPLPARGGQAPEPLDEVRLLAPEHLRTDIQRAVTADDYAQLVMREFGDRVDRAAAALRWTGSRYEAQVVIDPRGTVARDQALLDRIRAGLEPYRRIGHDIAVEQARYVPLELAMTVCVKPHFLRGHVKAALLEAFSNRVLGGGRRGFFHPDNLSFGDALYLSQLVAAAMLVPGVDNVRVDVFQRRFAGPDGEIEHGLLPLGPFEIARLDNDPSFPENGMLTFTMEGGR